MGDRFVVPKRYAVHVQIPRRLLDDVPALNALRATRGPEQLAEAAWLDGYEITGPVTSYVTDSGAFFIRNTVALLHEATAVPVRWSRTLRVWRRSRRALSRRLSSLAHRVDARRPEPADPPASTTV